MVKSDIISATKANRLYWLGRYEMRVYLTLHQLNKCCDEMIAGSPEAYHAVWTKLDAMGNYKTNDEFTLGMLYDENNPSSVISAQKCAMDNAILLREDIMSETLSYLEMSVALMKCCKEQNDKLLTSLQPVIDWSLAFWGGCRAAHPKPSCPQYRDDRQKRGEPRYSDSLWLSFPSCGTCLRISEEILCG